MSDQDSNVETEAERSYKAGVWYINRMKEEADRCDRQRRAKEVRRQEWRKRQGYEA